MKTYVIHGTAIVPVYGHLTVRARNKDEAYKKAMKTAKGFKPESGNWHTELWQNGDWTNDIRWDSAGDLQVTDVLEDDKPGSEAADG